MLSNNVEEKEVEEREWSMAPLVPRKSKRMICRRTARAGARSRPTRTIQSIPKVNFPLSSPPSTLHSSAARGPLIAILFEVHSCIVPSLFLYSHSFSPTLVSQIVTVLNHDPPHHPFSPLYLPRVAGRRPNMDLMQSSQHHRLSHRSCSFYEPHL